METKSYLRKLNQHAWREHKNASNWQYKTWIEYKNCPIAIYASIILTYTKPNYIHE